MIKERGIHWVPMLMVCVLIFGCAKNIKLSYPPSSRDSLTASKNPSAYQPPRQIKIRMFEDSRERPDIVGEIKNGYGIKIGEVKTDSNVRDWITNALIEELKNHGYDVQKVKDQSYSPEESVLSGTVLSVSASSGYTYQGDVSFLAKVERNGETLLEEPYYGRARPKLNMLARGKNYQEVLASALSLAIQNFLSDLAKLPQS